MFCTRPEHGANPGILDFQDAVSGPITYDLASLVMDARTTWEEPQQLDWAIRYWELARKTGLPVPTDFADFHQDYEWMGLQRNLRILGVFARLNHRDGKAAYLAHMPRVNQYVRQVAGRYLAFKPLLRILDELDQVQTKVGYTF
jgi:aminoglycoside/choline kinase family phosphotransferase